eukprot:325881-Rhodomonas_salina.1
MRPYEEEEEMFSETACCKSGGDACHVIYTSGTTGRPKGVVCEHRSLGTARYARLDVWCAQSSTDRVVRFGPDLAFCLVLTEHAMLGRRMAQDMRCLVLTYCIFLVNYCRAKRIAHRLTHTRSGSLSTFAPAN